MNMLSKSILLLILAQVLNATAAADKLKLPPGMGGVPDIGTIPCEVFNEMIVIGPLGTKRLLLTWAEGFYQAKSGKSIDELLDIANESGQSWDFDSLTGHFAEFCAANPDLLTVAAVVDLGAHLLNAATLKQLH
ncbi:MAG TPA: hypothetical protein QF499_12645 [Gammaproteobacteria bacterium]|jgi:hypothetical protein|nr:hypothetical protein [Gammaproteobacteria bacterium]